MSGVFLSCTTHTVHWTPTEVKKETENHHLVVAGGRDIIDPDRFVQSCFIYKGIGSGDHSIIAERHFVLHVLSRTVAAGDTTLLFMPE